MLMFVTSFLNSENDSADKITRVGLLSLSKIGSFIGLELQ